MKLPQFMASPRDSALDSGFRSKQNISSVSEEDYYGDVMTSFQVLTDVRTKYEEFLTHGQIVSAAAFDFARSLQDMALYTIEIFGDLYDGETGNAFSMLAKVQIEVSELLDVFASHVSQTVVKPMESMMDELQEAQVLKEKYIDSRKLCNPTLSNKQERFRKRKTSKKTEMVKEDMKKQADYLINHAQSLLQSQSQTLLTQVAKYHSTQLHLFSKSHFVIATAEPVMKQLAENMGVDCTLQEESAKNKLEDDGFGDEQFLNHSSEENDFKIKSKGEKTISAPISSSVHSRSRSNEQKSKAHIESFSTYVLPSPAKVVLSDQQGKSYFLGNTSKAYSSEQIGRIRDSEALREYWPSALTHSSESSYGDSGDTDSFLEPKTVKYAHSAPFTVKPSVDCGYLGAKSGPLRTPVWSSQTRHAAVPTASSPAASFLQISELHKLPLPPTVLSPPPSNPIRYSAPLIIKELPRSSPFPLPQPHHLVV